MFDDLKDQNNNDQDTTQGTASQSAPPSGLPGVQSQPDNNVKHDFVVVEDMLADSTEDVVKAPTTNSVDMSAHSEVPTTPVSVAPSMKPPVMEGIPDVSDDSMTWSDNSASTAGKKKMLLAGIVLVVIILLGIGGYIAYQRFVVQKSSIPIDKSSDTQQNANTNVNKVDVNSDNTGDGNTVSEPNATDSTNSNTDVNDTGLPIDSDGDGLTDQEELKYNTDPNLADTDRDGLFDREEVVSWKTDPLNPDTDGDSFLDGEEVKNGYDPLGPGKLKFFDQLNF